MPDLDAATLKAAVRGYFAACNSGDRDAFFALFEPGATHFLPKGMFGPFLDVESLFTQWRRDADENGSYWALDTVFADPEAGIATAEWSAIKPAQKIYYRGVDIFRFSAQARIEEVRVYYATARNPELGPNELGGYDYTTDGWWRPGDDPRWRAAIDA